MFVVRQISQNISYREFNYWKNCVIVKHLSLDTPARNENRFGRGWIWNLRESKFDLTSKVNMTCARGLIWSARLLRAVVKKTKATWKEGKGGNWSERNWEKNLATCSVLATELARRKLASDRKKKREYLSGFSEGRSMAIFHSLSSARINMH